MLLHPARVAGCECDAGGQVECANLNAARLPAFLDEVVAAANNKSITKLFIRQCEDAFGQLPDFPLGLRVRSLEISSCGLTDLNATAFAPTTADLIELRLMNNSLKTVPFLAHFSNLQTLNLNRNDLETVSEKSLNGLNKLVQLRLKKNRICSLPPKALDDVKKRLELLDLSLNCFSAVPARSLRNFKILKHLDLSSNQISELSDFQFMNLPELKENRLNDNRIVSFSARSFVNAAQVSHLYLRNNLLEAVDPAIPAFTQLASLKAVNLENDQVEKVDALTFSNNLKLISINLKANRSSVIARNSFDDLSSLNNLLLADNQLTTIESDILDGMPKLQLLLLANNTIGELTNSSFASLPELTFIDLANNQLQAIRAGTFVNQKKLYWLDLSNNRLAALERGSFSAPVANILFDANQLIYDSSIDWFITYREVNSIRTFHPNQSEVVCAGPEQYANVRIEDLMIKKANETLTTSMQKLGFNNVNNNNNNNEVQRDNFLASLLPALSGMGAGGATGGGNALLLGALAEAVPSLRNLPGGWSGMTPAPNGAGKGLEGAVEQASSLPHSSPQPPLLSVRRAAGPLLDGRPPGGLGLSTLIKSIPNLIVNLPGYGNIDISKVQPKIIEHVMKGGTLPGVPKESMDSGVKQVMQRVYAAVAHAQNQPIDQEVASNLPASGIDYKKYLRPLSELPETFVTSVMKGEPLPFLTPSQTEVVKGYYTQSIPVEAIGGPAMNLTDLATPGAMRMLKLLSPGYNISRIPADVIQGAMRGELPDITRLPSDLQNYIKDNWEKTFMALGNTPDVSVDEILKKLPKFDTVELTTFAPAQAGRVDPFFEYLNTMKRGPVQIAPGRQHSTAASNRQQADDFAGTLQGLEEDLIQFSNDKKRHFELLKERGEGALEDMDAHPPPPPFFDYAPNVDLERDGQEPAEREQSVTPNAMRDRDQEAEREGGGEREDETITSDDSFHEDEEEEEDADMRWGNERPEDEGEWPSDYLTEPDEDDEEMDGEVIFRRVMNRESRQTAVRSGGPPLPKRSASSGGRAVEPNARIGLVFSALIAAADDLRLQVGRPAGKPNGALREWPRVEKAADIAARFSKVMAERLQETVAWFERLMDRTESRVRLALALDPHDLPQRREPGTKEHPLDSLAYCLGLMREHTSETAGASPAFDTEILRPLCPLADCFLRHARVEEKLAEKKKASKQEGADESLRRFFRRSPSLCDPLETCERNRDAFGLAADEALPLVRRSALLTADAQPAELFGVPEETRTVEEHLKLERKRGIEHPRCLGWSDPPVRLVLKKSQQAAGGEGEEPTNDRTDVEVVGEWSAERRSAAEIFARRWPAVFRLLASLFEEDVLAELAGDLCDSPLLARFASFALKQKVLAEMMAAYTSRFNENLSLERMPRDPHLLLARVFDALQQRFTAHMISGGHHSTRRSAFAARKVVVSFSEEPGEGSGVFRSFLVAVADALARMEHLPMDREGTRAKQPPAVPPASPEDAEEQWDVNYRLVELPSGRLEFVSCVPSGRRKEADNSIRFEFVRHPPRHEPPAQQPADENAAEESPAKGEDAKQRRMADKFFAFTREHFPDHAKQIAGFFANGGLSTQQRMQLLMSPELMRDCGRALHGFLRQNGEPDYSVRREYGPLFRRTPAGFLTPVAGANSPHRVLAFRNVGRLIGIALQHGELLPLPLARHVLKFVLGRPVGWFDLAFADPVLFDSLRNVAWDETAAGPQSGAFFDQMDLSFVPQLRREEGGGLAELEPRGAERPVERENVLEYVRLFVEHRLVGDNRRALEAIRLGVEDVLPADALAHLSPEDLRLVLCGPERVNTRLLRSLCLFVDESSSTPYQLQAYKEWVFEAIEQLDEAQKQDLLHFWTGTPAFSPTTTPRPTVLIRPADDRLPTANTCISRLSIPFYNSKETLRLKLIATIQSRDFGFI
ncbi:hypothetical protein M3Y99_00573000 [Aphelenchoides fujianensis]|nr:hypothetical protein M3Y99_00573000 [Aphelenchoides fujianensis]